MEAAQKKGFFKGRLARPFSRVTKLRTITSHQQCEAGSCGSSKVVPTSSPSSSSSSISSGSSAAVFSGQNSANYSSSIPRVSTYSYTTTKHSMTRFHEQKSVADLPSSMQKVSIASFKPPSFYDLNGFANYDDTSGHDDENVDFQAETYISTVRERFNLDII